MARGLNKVMLIGNLGRDAETRYTGGGTAVTEFSVATARRTKDPQSGEWRDETDWHNVVLWRAENISKYLTKGRQVYVEGRLQTRSWEGQDGQKRYKTEVVADNFGVMLLGGRDGAEMSAPPAPRPQAGAASAGGGDDMGVGEDDVPF